MRFLERYVRPLTWLVFLLGVAAVYLTARWSIWAYFHPLAPSSPYAGYMSSIALIAAGLALLMAIRATWFAKRTARGRLLTELGIFLVALVPVSAGALLFVEPIPRTFTLYAGDDAYVIPRAYAPTGAGEPGGEAAFGIVYCTTDWRGVYARGSGDCAGSPLHLGTRPITGEYVASSFIDGELHIPRDGDRLSVPADVALSRIEGDGWTGYTTLGRDEYADMAIRHFIVGREGNLLLFSHCPGDEAGCDVYAGTPAGTLHYRHRNGPEFQPDLWKARQSIAMDILEGFRQAP